MNLGYPLAASLGTAHENMPGQDPNQAIMDSHNNEVGRDADFYLDNGNQNVFEYFQEKIESGELWIIVDGEVVPSNYTGN